MDSMIVITVFTLPSVGVGTTLLPWGVFVCTMIGVMKLYLVDLSFYFHKFAMTTTLNIRSTNLW